MRSNNVYFWKIIDILIGILVPFCSKSETKKKKHQNRQESYTLPFKRFYCKYETIQFLLFTSIAIDADDDRLRIDFIID